MHASPLSRPFAVLAALLLGLGPIARLAAVEPKVFNHEAVLGTSLEVRVVAPDDAAAHAVEAAVLDEIDRLEAIFSTYAPDSEFLRWLRSGGEPVKVSPELFEVMHMAEDWRQRTGGAFNAGAAVFTQIWRDAAKGGIAPAPAELSAAAARINGPAWRLDASTGTAARLADYPLSLDAIAKGYIVERAGRAALASTPGVTSLVVNIGGDLRIWGDEAFPVAITNPIEAADNGAPIETVAVSGAGLATSGGYRRNLTVGEARHSHLIDARTGETVSHIVSSSVIAPDAATADALATAFSILDPVESARVASTVAGASFFVVTEDGTAIRSSRWPGAAGGSVFAATAAAGGTDARFWGTDNEVVVNFEINSPTTSRRYARPYVAIWVEDNQGRAVRTLLVWYNRPRWLPDLRRWTRADAQRARTDSTDVLAIVSDATRGPGQYFLTWDGLDDAKKPLPAGTYTVYIEAVREHGTYQLMQQDVVVGGDASKASIEGNEEIKAASVEYRRRETAR